MKVKGGTRGRANDFHKETKANTHCPAKPRSAGHRTCVKAVSETVCTQIVPIFSPSGSSEYILLRNVRVKMIKMYSSYKSNFQCEELCDCTVCLFDSFPSGSVGRVYLCVSGAGR